MGNHDFDSIFDNGNQSLTFILRMSTYTRDLVRRKTTFRLRNLSTKSINSTKQGGFAKLQTPKMYICRESKEGSIKLFIS